MAQIGKNITYTQKGDIVTLTIDLKQDLGPSASGKSQMVATTNGFTNVEGVGFSVNVTRKK